MSALTQALWVLLLGNGLLGRDRSEKQPVQASHVR